MQWLWQAFLDSRGEDHDDCNTYGELVPSLALPSALVVADLVQPVS